MLDASRNANDRNDGFRTIIEPLRTLSSRDDRVVCFIQGVQETALG
jgi:hypothetical protein